MGIVGRRTRAAAAAIGALLATAGTAQAIDFGATDDTGKYLGAESAPYFETMRRVGLSVNTMTLHYDPVRRIESSEASAVQRALPVASRLGVAVTLRLYPARPTSLAGDAASAKRFAAWAAGIARRYPAVRTFVIGNEPNQPRFWQPQFDRKGRQLSAPAAGRILAAAYDALKRVDPEITVVGLGLSSRGNDRPFARSNASTSPVRFLAALGTWYRRSGRDRPLMDALAFHPYPNTNTEPLAKGYEWPNAGIVDLGRLKLAVWDAFHGTAQPTPADGLPLVLNEIAWQVDTSGNDAYTGEELVAVTTEERQAQVYGEVVRRAACDPGVGGLSFFSFFDQRERDGMQGGLFRVDGTPRPSAATVTAAIARGSRSCGARRAWQPPRGVVGGKVFFADRWRPNCYGTQGGKRLCLTAGENARYRIGTFPAGTPRAEIARRLLRGPGVLLRGSVKAYGRPSFAFEPPAEAGSWVIAVRLAAAANPKRATLVVSRPLAG
jgi:hypothetical protein